MSKYIFSINSGRSGSKYLAGLLLHAKDTASFHETPPVMANENLMNQIHLHPYKKSYDLRKKKVEAIKKAKGNCSNYAETNHMFIKTFFDVVIDEFGPEVRVIILRRHLPLVVKSFVELEYFGQNAESFKWMTKSNAVTRAIEPINHFNKMDIFDRTISYLIDIEARAARFKKDYPNITVLEYNVTDLNDLATVEDMFSKLGLEGMGSLKSAVNVTVNQRQSRKKTFKRQVSFQEAADRVDKYINRAKHLGIPIPSDLCI